MTDDYCAENGADIISCSWGHYGGIFQAVQDILDYAMGLGSIIVGAAGNSDTDELGGPACYPGVISVASVASDDHKSYYSNYGAWIDIASPGGDIPIDGGILSTVPGGLYDVDNGTSMATPLVSGLLALIKSYHPDWTNEQLKMQLYGTADDINDLNPGLENMLGYGRINAYRALSESNVYIPEGLQLSAFEIEVDDSNNDGFLNQGEAGLIHFSLWNFSEYSAADDLMITLVSNDPEVSVICNPWTGSIGTDDHIEIHNHFIFLIDVNATPHTTELILQVESETPIFTGAELTVQIQVEPSGILVWEGVEDGEDYSGSFIRDQLIEWNYNVYYSNILTGSLNNYEALFLSFGEGEGNYTLITFENAFSILEYLMNGGKVYLESSNAFGWDLFWYDDFLNAFGISSAEIGENNPIDGLQGVDDTITEGMFFTGSEQENNLRIDQFATTFTGSEAFYESDYGCVAVQNEGIYEQKTFCFSYALAELEDGEFPSTRENLLAEIVDFFELEPDSSDVEEPLIPNSSLLIHNLDNYPNPFNPTTTISFSISNEQNVQNELPELVIYNIKGQKIKEFSLSFDSAQDDRELTNSVTWNGTDNNNQPVSSGIYFYKLKAGDQVLTRKMVLLK